jgi:hypothetical protein
LRDAIARSDVKLDIVYRLIIAAMQPMIPAMQWSNYFPESCPPPEAESRSIVVYRFLANNEISPEDFVTVRQKNPDRKFPEVEKECRACSLSVFISREEVIRLQRKVPRWRRPVATGSLIESSGKLKHTPSPGTNNSHHSWWIPVDIEPWTLFDEIISPPLA